MGFLGAFPFPFPFSLPPSVTLPSSTTAAKFCDEIKVVKGGRDCLRGLAGVMVASSESLSTYIGLDLVVRLGSGVRSGRTVYMLWPVRNV